MALSITTRDAARLKTNLIKPSTVSIAVPAYSQRKSDHSTCQTVSAFSPDGSILYVADSGAALGYEAGFNPEGRRAIYVFPITVDGHLEGEGKWFTNVTKGVPDGIRCDERGHVWAATHAGLECYRADGTLEGIIRSEAVVSNFAFRGLANDQVMVTNDTRVLLIDLA